MAARVGLSRDDVVAEAIIVLDEVGAPSQVTMAGVAQRLGVRTQSLYAHVDSAEELARAMALVGLAELASAVTDAAVGRSGPPALKAMVRAQLAFALDRTGLFCASLRPPGEDPELRDATRAVVAPFERVLGDMGVAGAAAVHWTRITLSAVYGLALLRRDGQLTVAVEVAETVDRLIEVLADSVPAHLRSP